MATHPLASALLDQGGPRLLLTEDADAAAAAVAALLEAGWAPLPELDARAPEAPRRAAWARGDLAAVELGHHWLFARAVVPSDDVLILVAQPGTAADRSLAELRRLPAVAPLPPAPRAAAVAPASPVRLSAPEVQALRALDDPVALARAAEQSGDQGWVLRPSTLLELRQDLLLASGLPPEHPLWGEGGWAWWRHMDSPRAAAALEDLLARADRFGWPSAPRLRMALGLVRLLFADPELSRGLLERALDELRAEPASDEEILVRLGLVIARDRLGQDSRPLLAETVARARPHISARLRAQVLDAQGAAAHRAGQIDLSRACFQQAAQRAAEVPALRFEALQRARALEVAITGARVEPDLTELRALRRQVAAVGGLRSAMTVLQLHGDVARRLGALDEAEEAYRALAALLPGAARPLGFALLDLERGDHAAADARLRDAAHSREPTGRKPTQLIEAVSLPIAEVQQDLQRWEAALHAWPLEVRGGQIDVARAAEAAARMAFDRAAPEAGVRALRATRLAMAHWAALGRADRAERLKEEAVRRVQPGWPVPLGPLDLIGRVARGGTSAVWRARHRELDLEVAVKVLTGDQARDPAAVAALDAEIRATARLRHPHIVAVRDLGVVDDLSGALLGQDLPAGSPFVALEWVGGGTLARRAAPLDWPACQAVLRQVLAALAHAHSAGLVHRDVKPENVMWAGEDRGLPVVKLVDFGLVGVGGHLIAGTPAYMAPEQFRGQGVGPWSDLYAVGCLATALVQGRPPFAGSTLPALRIAHCEEPVPPLETQIPVPAGLGAWLEGLLAKDPRHRYPNAGAARAALDALGPPGATRRPIALDAAPEDNRTIVLAELDLPSPARAPSAAGQTRPLAPVPPWTGAVSLVTPRPLGSALAGMGTPPVIGRGAVQAALWRALEAARPGAPVALLIQGSAGAGVSSLLRWFRREVLAAGCAELLPAPGARAAPAGQGSAPQVLIADEPSAAEEAQLREALATPGPSPLLLVLGTRDAAIAARWQRLGAAVHPLSGLELEQLVVLARDLAPLRGEEALSLARAADGSPAALSHAILDGLRAQRFIPTREGLVSRPGFSASSPAIAAIRGALLEGLDPAQSAALSVVALVGAHAGATERAWDALGLRGVCASLGDRVELRQGQARLRQPGSRPALLLDRPPVALRAACAAALAPVPGPSALADRVSLLLGSGHAPEGVDRLGELAWSWPGDVGELRLWSLCREASDALAATGAAAQDPRWGRIALVEARAALLGVDYARALDALRRAAACPPPEAPAQIPYLTAVATAQTAGRPAGVASLEAALASPLLTEDAALRLRYRTLLATLQQDGPALATLAAEASASGLPRLAGDAWRSLARLITAEHDREEALAALSQGIAAYRRAGSDYGVALCLGARASFALEQGEEARFVADVEEAARALRVSLGAISVLTWLQLAVARLIAGRMQDAADGLAAAMALGLGRLPETRRIAGLLAVVLAAEGPSEAWLGATALLRSEPPSPERSFEDPLLRRAIARAAAAGLHDRVAWLEAARSGR